MISSNAVSLNKEKINLDFNPSDISLINQQYLLVQKGKKNYFVIKVS
jgi:tyrosyl-tRNA synthetase